MTTASHPRPDFVREGWWCSLDGTWELSVAGRDRWQPVVVPAPWESPRSRVGLHWVERARYRRRLEVPAIGLQEQVVLHFQAVHYRATVVIDGTMRVEHVGGQLPFEVDLSDVAGRTVELLVLVEAPIDKAEIPHGKQRSIPADPYDVCSFTPCSGIWQSVWLERRPSTHLRSVRFVPGAGLDRFTVTARVDGDADRVSVEAVGTGESASFAPGTCADLLLEEPRVWLPDDPQLYELLVRVHHEGRVLDTVRCTTGLRTVAVHGAELLLNGERIHLRGVLDQGYWPGSGWTAPDEAALAADLRAAREAGFTLVRKHLKLEDPRWLHLADRLGMLVWEEPPSTARFSASARAAFESQIAPMIERDANHPSILVWGLYNEEWGLDWDVANDPAKAAALARAYDLAKAADPSRPVVDNSGWSHVRTDLVDWHVYRPDPPSWLTAMEGLPGGFEVDLGPGGVQAQRLFADGSSAAGRALLNSEYGTGRTSVERAWLMRWQTQELRRRDESNGYVYCELYDIEHEIAGVLTAERRPKDDLGLPAADVHADTVLVLDLVPLAPGADLVTPDGGFSLRARVSSHAPEPARLRMLSAWGPPLSRDPWPSADPRSLGLVEVKPFELSAPLTVSEHVPPGRAAARLHLWLVQADAPDPLAHTVLDVRVGSA